MHYSATLNMANGFLIVNVRYELEQNPRFAKRQIKTGRDYERSEYTDPRNTVIVRLWKKAQKNIEAVERGEFPLGH